VTSTADREALIAHVEDRLRGIGRVVRNSMLDAMPDGEPHRWLYGPMREYPARAGKALRPALCLSAGRAFGAESDELLGIAVAIELLQMRSSFTMTSSMEARCVGAERHWRPVTVWVPR
jgi:geranylgeranyl diphosphate synthase, type II